MDAPMSDPSDFLLNCAVYVSTFHSHYSLSEMCRTIGPDRHNIIHAGPVDRLKKHGCTSSPRILKITVIVYDNKHLHIIELEDTRSVFILFILFISNKI
jgi:hypothetical protein